MSTVYTVIESTPADDSYYENYNEVIKIFTTHAAALSYAQIRNEEFKGECYAPHYFVRSQELCEEEIDPVQLRREQMKRNYHVEIERAFQEWNNPYLDDPSVEYYLGEDYGTLFWEHNAWAKHESEAHKAKEEQTALMWAEHDAA